jgi:hypothetical protein
MVRKTFSRLRQIGYIRAHNVWIIGENLHLGTVGQSTPADTVGGPDGQSGAPEVPAQRQVSDLGVAAARGIPSDPAQSDGITVASEYGFRAS